LGEVAAKYGISTSKLKKWNHLRKSTIQVGQRLKILK
jgi:LysM repeat protein